MNGRVKRLRLTTFTQRLLSAVTATNPMRYAVLPPKARTRTPPPVATVPKKGAHNIIVQYFLSYDTQKRKCKTMCATVAPFQAQDSLS